MVAELNADATDENDEDDDVDGAADEKEDEDEVCVLDSIVVSIRVCHMRDPGSIPGRGEFFAK